MDTIWKRRDQGMIIKLYMENAFDRVRHEFLFKVMQKMGFSSSFIQWVALCISSPWIDPLVNGRVAGFFKTSRGLR